MARVASGGAAIVVEVWELASAELGSFLSGIPAPLGLGKIELADGSWETGFICEGSALTEARDITAWGSWLLNLAVLEVWQRRRAPLRTGKTTA